jgi:hypothetical protein
MSKLVLGILVLVSLLGCEQSRIPIVGTWSHTVAGTTVTYTFNADHTCSLAVVDAAGGTRTLNGIYTFAYLDSIAQLQVIWKDSATSNALPSWETTPVSWNPTTNGLCISLDRQ